MRPSPLPAALLYAVFTLSGAAGLGYQLVWTKILALSLGHEFASLLGVVTAFFVGLCAGSWLADSSYLRSVRGARLYAAAEAVIAVASVLAFFVEPALSSWAIAISGENPSPVAQWAISFGLPALILLPATAAMGITFPAMERHVSATDMATRAVAGLYACNTAGAVLGIVGSAYLILPAYGHRSTLLLFVALNAFCTVAAWQLTRSEPRPPRAGTFNKLSTRAAALLMVTGLLGIGVEIVAVRVLTQVFEGTVYSYAAVLAVYLTGTALGAALYRWVTRTVAVENMQSWLLLGLAFSTQLAVLALDSAPKIYRACRVTLGDTLPAVIVSESALAASALLLPTLLMGALFSHLVQACRDQRASVGAAVALNTFGAALAPATVGVLLLPLVGTRWSFALLGLGYLALLSWRRPVPLRRGVAAAAIVAFALVLPARLQIITLRPGEWLVEHREGTLASVAVVGKGNERNLRVNNRYQMGGTNRAAKRIQERQAHIALLMHPAPRSALFLGVASGITVGAASRHPDLRIDAVELVPEILSLLPYFEPDNAAPQHHPSVRLMVADARRFVRATTNKYDVIVGDLFHPAVDGAGALYTEEHFRAIRSRLSEGGTFCQWLPAYQLDDSTLRAIVATFLRVFPDAIAVLADDNLEFPAVGLIGGPIAFAPLKSHPDLARHLGALGLNSPVGLSDAVIADNEALTRYAHEAPINTDDYPFVVYRAPRFAAQRGTAPYGRMTPLLGADAVQLKADGWTEHAERRVRSRNLALLGVIAESDGQVEDAMRHYQASIDVSDDNRLAHTRLHFLKQKRPP